MESPAKALGHHYSVALRVSGDEIDPQQVTRLLKVQPAQAWKKGEDERPRSKTGGWELRLEPEGGRFWLSLDDGLNALMDAIALRRKEVRELALQHEVFWWVGHFQTSFDGGPMISAATLERLGAFGIALYVDNYFSQGESDGD